MEYIDGTTGLPQHLGELYCDRNIKVVGEVRINSSNPLQIDTKDLKILCPPSGGGEEGISMIADATYPLSVGGTMWAKVTRLGSATVVPEMYTSTSQPRPRKDYIQLFYMKASGTVISYNNNFVIENSFYTSLGSTTLGMVPIGGMVTVMPNIQSIDAWQPPDTGVIKDGFMRADGHIITPQNVADGSKLRAGTPLPNMIQKYPRGNSTSGSTDGANTVTLAANQIPQLSGAFTSGVNSVNHSHTITTGGISANHTHSGSTGTESADHAHYTSGTTTAQSVNHTHGVVPGGGPIMVDAGSTYGVPAWNGGSTTGGISVDHTHTWGNWSGGRNTEHSHSFTTGTVSADHTHSGTTSGVSANHTHATTVTLGSASPSSVNNEPAYVEVIWVIRVA